MLLFVLLLSYIVGLGFREGEGGRVVEDVVVVVLFLFRVVELS